MTVINTQYDYYQGEPGNCVLCSSPLRYPFLHWDVIKICGPCCRHIKAGFIADLIQVAASVDIQSLGGRDHSGYYANARLVRRSAQELESAGQREREAWAKAADGAIPLTGRKAPRA
jgi:hypothetical protein